jgi:hypothetical protein
MSKGCIKKSGVPTESAEQKWVIQWSMQPSIRQLYPELAMLYHIPNERTDKIQAAILKAMGVKPGVPDLHLPISAGRYHGLYIEMKAIDGRPDADQLWWAEHLKANGYAHAFCYGWQQATEVLTWYLSLKKQA